MDASCHAILPMPENQPNFASNFRSYSSTTALGNSPLWPPVGLSNQTISTSELNPTLTRCFDIEEYISVPIARALASVQTEEACIEMRQPIINQSVDTVILWMPNEVLSGLNMQFTQNAVDSANSKELVPALFFDPREFVKQARLESHEQN